MRLVDALRKIRPTIVQAVQRAYDGEEYSESPVGEVVQAAIAEAIEARLGQYGVSVIEGGAEDDQAFVIAYTADEAAIVDISYDLYCAHRPAEFEAQDVYVHGVDRKWADGVGSPFGRSPFGKSSSGS